MMVLKLFDLLAGYFLPNAKPHGWESALANGSTILMIHEYPIAPFLWFMLYRRDFRHVLHLTAGSYVKTAIFITPSVEALPFFDVQKRPSVCPQSAVQYPDRKSLAWRYGQQVFQ